MGGSDDRRRGNCQHCIPVINRDRGGYICFGRSALIDTFFPITHATIADRTAIFDNFLMIEPNIDVPR